MAKKKNNKNRRGKKEAAAAAAATAVGIEEEDRAKRDEDEEEPAVTSEPTPSATTIDDRKLQAQDIHPAEEEEEKPVDFATLRDTLERASLAKKNTTQNIPDNKWNERFKKKDEGEASDVKEKVVTAANKGEAWSPQREVPKGSVSQQKELLETSTANDVFYSCRDFAQDVEELATAPDEIPKANIVDEALEKEDTAAVLYSCKGGNTPDLEKMAAALEQETPDEKIVSMVDYEAPEKEVQSAIAEETTVESKKSSSKKGNEDEATTKVDLSSSSAEDAKEQHSKEGNVASPPASEEEEGVSRAATTAAETTPTHEANETIVAIDDDDDKGSWATATKLYHVLTKLMTRACCTKRVRSSRQ